MGAHCAGHLRNRFAKFPIIPDARILDRSAGLQVDAARPGSNRREECVQMPGKMTKSILRPPFRPPRVPAAVRSTKRQVLMQANKNGFFNGNPTYTIPISCAGM